MAEAVEAVLSKRLSLRASASAFSVPKSSLERFMKKLKGLTVPFQQSCAGRRMGVGLRRAARGAGGAGFPADKESNKYH